LVSWAIPMYTGFFSLHNPAMTCDRAIFWWTCYQKLVN
jgi:hypothetical protein